MITLVLSAFSVTSHAQIDYPHLKLYTEGIAAPDCNDVPKLLIGSTHPCSDSDMASWLKELRGWRVQSAARPGDEVALRL